MHEAFIKFTLLLWLILGLNVSLNADDHRSLVIVTAADSEITSLTKKQIRSIFLGAPIKENGILLLAYRNRSDPSIEDIFLQEVIFMSRRSYERRILSNVFRYGGERIKEFTDLKSLVEELNETEGAISYIWEDELEKFSSIKSIGEIWTE